MPIYEYQCLSCKHEFEALRRLSDAPLKECPECKQESLKKKISAAGFRLSGSGWYETDFKRSGNKKNIAGDSEKSVDGKAKEPRDASTKSDAGGKGESGAKTDASAKSDTGKTTKSNDSKPAKSSAPSDK